MLVEDQLRVLLEKLGWRIRRTEAPRRLLPDALRVRYPALPQSAEAFLGSLHSCVSPSQQEWFLCVDDFAGSADDAFRWNELELIGLDGASESERKAVAAFWDVHLPVTFAVHSDYAYLALSLAPETFGSVVFGIAPELESTTLVATSFDAFAAQFSVSLTHGADYPLNLFARDRGA